MSTTTPDAPRPVDRQTKANAIRALSMDAAKAKSGHPGMPMGMADISEVRCDFQHNPSNPSGRIETGLFSPTVMAQCCITLC